MNRYEIFKKFQKSVQAKDERTMDEICQVNNTEFQLQAQQQFLREYMIAYPKWDRLLLYHQIGSGKTCSSITMAEEYLRTYPENKIKVILPARLRTNFIDELISPCGMDAYISKQNYVKFMSKETSDSAKAKIKAKFNRAINARYEVLSFEKFKNMAYKHRDDLKDWLKAWSDNCMIIVDEVHNLFSDKFDVKKSKKILDEGVVGDVNPKGMNTILFMSLCKYAHPTCKMVLMTATPVFDNISQIKQLVQAMAPGAVIGDHAKLSDVLSYLKGKVSYFPGTSENAYPSVEFITHEVPLSEEQDEMTDMIIEAGKEGKNPYSEEFLAKQRQTALVYVDIHEKADDPEFIEKVLDDLGNRAPKLKVLYNSIKKFKGKHVVYSNFVQKGLRFVEALLKKNGWTNFLDKTEKHTKGKVYALWDGSVEDADKQAIKSAINSKDNIFGDVIRVLLGSPSIREGVSFKHVQHLHILDPVWNFNAKLQVEGRAIRFCSHVDIDEEKHKPLKRRVVVNYYKIMPRKGGLVPETCDQLIYDTIIEKKKKFVMAAEKALKKIAIDHYLFRGLYAKQGQKFHTPTEESPIGLRRLDDVLIYKKVKDNKKSTCPPARRPRKIDENSDETICPPNKIKQKNKQGFECCYKIKVTKNKDAATCPKKRRPVNETCPNPAYPNIRYNNHGVECCYKK